MNFTQIEKELYAVLFGCKRFHEYMYGQRVIVESNESESVYARNDVMLTPKNHSGPMTYRRDHGKW